MLVDKDGGLNVKSSKTWSELAEGGEKVSSGLGDLCLGTGGGALLLLLDLTGEGGLVPLSGTGGADSLVADRDGEVGDNERGGRGMGLSDGDTWGGVL